MTRPINKRNVEIADNMLTTDQIIEKAREVYELHSTDGSAWYAMEQVYREEIDKLWSTIEDLQQEVPAPPPSS